ncbi:hypothetical protein [Shimia sp.]|uniref:hypothetical protein n=1 Tax=Shimia sp. TaxID=1954381 RepID=UPI00329748CD
MNKKIRTVFLVIVAFFPMLLLPLISRAQGASQSVCSTEFFRPYYPSRQKFCSVGEMVADAYDPALSFPCEEMEVDHLISLRYAHKNGICDPDELKKLANDPDNLRLTHWRTNRAKGAMSAEEFAIRRLSESQADRVLADVMEIRKKHRLPKSIMTPDLKASWLIAERDRLQKMNARLIKDASELRYKHVIYRGKKMQAAKAVSFHTSRISRIVTWATFRNFGSMAAEAIPFFGVAAIVGVTALEITDACETLKANYDLNVAFNPTEAIPEEVQTVCSIEVPTKDELIKMVAKSPSQAWAQAKSYTPSLPEVSDFEINWERYMEATKSGALWLIEETGASMYDLSKAINDYWGSEIMDGISLDKIWPFGDQ